MRKRNLVSALAATLVMSTLAAACSSNKPAPAASDNKNASAPAAGNASAQATAYPLKTDKTLTYWAELAGNLTGVKGALEAVPFFQDWQKKTGVKLKFTTVPANQGKQQLTVMLASGDLPDMIEFSWGNSFPGGPEKAIKDGYIMKLNDLLAKDAPNLMKYLRNIRTSTKWSRPTTAATTRSRSFAATII